MRGSGVCELVDDGWQTMWMRRRLKDGKNSRYEGGRVVWF